MATLRLFIFFYIACWLMELNVIDSQTTANSLQRNGNQIIKSEIPSKVPINYFTTYSTRDKSLAPFKSEQPIIEFKLYNKYKDEAANKPIRMTMGSSKTFDITMVLLRNLYPFPTHVNLEFITLSPHFEILFSQDTVSNSTWLKLESEDSLIDGYFRVNLEVTLHARYIGHAVIVPKLLRGESIKINSENVTYSLPKQPEFEIPVTIIRDESVWEIIFIVSVTILVVVSYINLGAQLDLENLKETIKKPKTMLLGFLLTVAVMPIISWFTFKCLIPDQLLYRIGSFVFATTPAATASPLWTVMLEADKELSVSLQVLSTLGSLLSMPISLYLMDIALTHERAHYVIQVPYMKLLQSIIILLIALFIGWRLLGRTERSRKISARVFKPLIFAVLFYIIIFSSTLYWFIYRMFSWTITLNSFLVAIFTYLATGALGYLINFNLDHAITISISSAYKNSGIAFAILLVTFDAPDYFIAYVPCLTQVVVTSLMLYIIYSGRLLYIRTMRKNQLEPIQATKPENNSNIDQHLTVSVQSDKAEEEEEFIDVNVTDEPSPSLKVTPPVDPPTSSL